MEQPFEILIQQAICAALWFFVLVAASIRSTGPDTSGVDYKGQLKPFFVVACCYENLISVVPQHNDVQKDAAHLRALLWINEPTSIVQERTEFLRHLLVGLLVFVPTHDEVRHIDNGGEPSSNSTYWVTVIDNPTDIFLADGTSVIELMLRNGLVAFDPQAPWLSPSDRYAYEHAQSYARRASLGIWKDRIATVSYDNMTRIAAEEQQAQESRAPLYVWMELLLAALLLLLLVLTKRDRASWGASTTLCLLPPAFLLLYFWTGPWVPIAPDSVNPDLGESWFLLVMCCGLVAMPGWLIMARGPLAEWHGTWIGKRAWYPITMFFLAIWGMILAFALALLFLHAVPGLGSSFGHAIGLVLGLADARGPLETKLYAGILLVKGIIVFGFAAWLPTVRKPRHAGSLAIAVALASYIIFFVVVVSAFGVIYMVGGATGSFSAIIDKNTSLWLAITNFVGMPPINGIVPSSTFMWLLWVLEAHIGLFSILVAGGYLFATRIPPIEQARLPNN